jgi:hypothetical protein
MMAATTSAVDDLFWGAAASLRANLPPSGDSILNPDAPAGQLDLGLLQLPGEQSDAKAAFERELLALIHHVSLLQDGTLHDHASPPDSGIATSNDGLSSSRPSRELEYRPVSKRKLDW